MGKNIYIDIVVYFIKTFVMNIYICYCFSKITNTTLNCKKNNIILLIFNIVISVLYTYIDYISESAIVILITYSLFGMLISYLTKNKIGYTIALIIISNAISSIAFMISTIVNYPLYYFIYDKNDLVSLISMILIQFILIYGFFKIKRFRKGIEVINNKVNSDITDVVMVFVSVAIILVKSFMGTLYQGIENIIVQMLVTLSLLGITMYIVIKRTLTTHYKQTQLLKTLDEYKAEIDEKNKEIERLSNEKYNTSRIRHEFYNRQKALELMVKQTIGDSKTEFGEIGSENILKIIENLSDEYSKECDKVKQLPELKKTGIFEIDSMFKYMQNECANNNISFKLRIIGEIYPLVNNIIPKDRLETLIGDHIRDSINAINNEGVENREILVLLGKKDKKYELSIHDTGIEFEIDTLLKLGAMRVTTCEAKGGTGIGFMTTFETLRQTGASLIITENKPSDKRYYTKSITIRFDEKQQYKVISYRAAEIEKTNNRKDIIISKLSDKN